uniref:BED-type domain-containing protein n=1 Tax=Bactrocera latifrons TaxID=174628 RepID=A0A0K8UXV7_BACLA
MSTVSADYEDQQTDISLGVRKKVSIVWRYFEKLDRLRVRCRLCRHEQNYQGTTGNILRHLKNKHNIDATLKGQQANPNMASKFVKEIEEKSNGRTADEDCSESDFLKIEPTDVSSSSRRVDDVKSKETLGEELDPYTDNALVNNLFVIYCCYLK